MKKIDLTEDDSKALEQLATSGLNAYPVLKKIFKHYEDELVSVLNIDSKGNMGLQTLARQKAHEMIKEISEQIFLDDQSTRKRVPGQDEKKAISPYR